MEVELDKAMNLAGHGRYNVVVLLVSSTVHLASLLDLLGFCVVVPAASCDLKLGITEMSLLTSMPFAGYLTALPWGYYADTRGRRKALLISATVGSIMGVITSFATSFKVMLVLKVLGCVFSSASMTLSITYLGECTGDKHRTKYMFILNCFNLAADFVCYALAYFILGLDFIIPIPWLSITYRPWRLFTLAMALIMGAGAVMMFFLHESPKFLANKGEIDKALHILKTAYGVKKHDEELVMNSLLAADKGRKPTITFWSSVVQQTVPIFRPPLLKRTLQLYFLLAVCASTNNVFYIWFPTMVNSFFNSLSNDGSSFCERITASLNKEVVNNATCNDKISSSTIYSGMAFSLFFTLLNYIASLAASQRKIILIVTLVLSGLSTIIVNLVYEPISSMIFFILIQISGIGGGNVASYYVDVFPTSYRGLATSLGLMCARMFSLTGVNIVGTTIIDHCRVTFFSWAVFVFSGVVVSIFLPKNTSKLRGDDQI